MTTLLKGDLCQALLDAEPRHGDVYVVSGDRRYFLAHRIVLISASDVLDRVLVSILCSYLSAEIFGTNF
jgi:hypothetical protein